MKHLLALGMTVFLTQAASADVKLLSLDDVVKIKITGESGKELAEVLGSVGFKKQKAKDDDSSIIQSIDCSQKGECTLEVLADYYETRDVHSQELGGMFLSDKSLARAKKMKDSQVMIQAPSMGLDGFLTKPRELDGTILKALMSSAAGSDNITIKHEKRTAIKQDTAVIPVFSVTMKTADIEITCSSGIQILGERNVLDESCSFEVIANK